MRTIIQSVSVALLAGLLLAAAAPEVPPAKELPCFPGAYYRKAVSSTDVWTGIEGTVVLPALTFDETRRRPNKPDQFLDNPSVYIGGRAGEQEIDAGLTWEVVKLPDGTVSKDRRAFRPFWRNKGWFSAPAQPDLYFYPGDTVKLRIETAAADELTLTVELLERGPNGHEKRTAYPPATQPSRISVTFKAPGFGPGRQQEFKRVNAIDQVGREGKPVEATTTKIAGARWTSVSLLRGAEVRPFTPERFTDMKCPAPAHFTTMFGENGGEEITIRGTPTGG